MEFAVDAPINSSSLGQVSTAILREFFHMGIELPLFPAGGSISLDSHKKSNEFENWVLSCVKKSFFHDRRNPSLKIWHLSGSLQSFSEKQTLLTFYETNAPTKEELNVIRNNNILVTSKYTAEVFNANGQDAKVIPLGFDSENFKIINKKYFEDDRITFNLCGKFERRKHHKKIIQSWLKKYGNNKKYYLQCALYNNFFSEEENKEIFKSCLEGRNFYNVQFLSYMPQNENYNDFLNSSNIIIGMSGGEGWGLPEFQSVALGKHSVILNAHGYKEWADEANSVLIEPSGEIDSHDGKFFRNGDIFNQGTFFDWKEDDFIDGCEQAIKRHSMSQVNEDGIALQKCFSFKETADILLKEMRT